MSSGLPHATEPHRASMAPRLPEEELEELTNAWHASLASAIAFTLGTILPLTAILLAPTAWRVPITVIAVLTALALTGVLSSRIGGSRAKVAVVRVVLGGAAGLALTYGIGRLFGSAVGWVRS